MGYRIYFLPERKVLFYPYTLTFALFGYMLGLVLENHGVFRYYGFWRYISPVFFSIWFTAGAWAYLKIEGFARNGRH